MNITTKIVNMKPVKEKPFEGTNGPIWYVEGAFLDGSGFSSGSKSLDKAKERHAEFSDMIDKEGVFEVEDTGRLYQGNRQYRLKAWPGKPSPSFGGGFGGGSGRSFQPRFRDTPEGARAEQESIHRSVALQQAVLFYPKATEAKPEKSSLEASMSDLTAIAEKMYDWLISTGETAAAPVQNPEQGQPVEQAPSTHGQGGTGRQDIACPNCGGTEHVRRSKLDGTPPWYCYKKIGGCGFQWGEKAGEQKPFPETPAGGQPTISAYDKYVSEIKRADSGKDQARLAKLSTLIAESKIRGSITDQEAQSLLGSISHIQWYATAVSGAQKQQMAYSKEMEELAGRF